MNIPSFSPLSATPHFDSLHRFFLKSAALSFFVTFLAWPLLFLPRVAASLGVAKIYILLFGISLSLILLALATLRSGRVSYWFSPVVVSFGAVVAAAALSGILAASIKQSFFGVVLDVFTVGNLALLGMVLVTTMVLVSTKRTALFISVGLFAALSVVSWYQLFVVLTKGQVFGMNLPAWSQALVGSLADVGILAGFLVVVTLVIVSQKRLSGTITAILGLNILVALFNLLLLNAGFLWLMLSGFSLLLLVYSLVKDLFILPSERVSSPKLTIKNLSVVILLTVFLVTTAMLFLGTSFNQKVTNYYNLSYMDVRPNIAATISIGKDIYRQNFFTGSGPNTFVENWRLYKTEDINQTVFWNTSFFSGGSYLFTWFVTTGVIGVLAWLFFLGSLVYEGLRMLLRKQDRPNTLWFLFGSAAFSGAIYLWAVLLLMTAGFVPILIAVATTGLLVVSAKQLSGTEKLQLVVNGDRQKGFALVAGVLVLIVFLISFNYLATKQLLAAYNYVTLPSKISAEAELGEWEAGLVKSYQLYTYDLYLRELVGVYQSRLGQLLAIAEPDDGDREEFEGLFLSTISTAETAVSLNPRDVNNWLALASTYSLLVSTEVEGADDKANDTFKHALSLEPNNPLYNLYLAQVSARMQKYDESREYLDKALKQKPNFTEALNFSAQLEATAGNLDKAIASTKTLLKLEPNVPGRYYQLGVLEIAKENPEEAIKAFTRALELDSDYANARYMRAIQYLNQGEKDLAITELESVKQLSPDNDFLIEIISKIKSGEITEINVTGGETPVVSENVPPSVGAPPKPEEVTSRVIEDPDQVDTNVTESEMVE